MSESPIQKLYIDGGQVDAIEGKTFSNYSPSTGEKICDVQSAGPSDVERAVASSEKGFEKWSSLSATQRGKILMKAGQLLRDRCKELAYLEVQDTGKPISEALSIDVPTSADAIEYFGGIAATLHGQHFDLGSSFVYTRREPLGVCAGIGAWNFPLQIACWKSAPALAAGNSMVFKPSELTPLTAMKLAEIYSEAGVPDGVFNVLQGAEDTGRALSEHPRIHKISLTGSVPTGKNVMRSAASSLKHVTLELGGKSPLIIFEDSRMAQAVSAALVANFSTQGEICSNGTRVFVQESILNEFLDRLIPLVKQIKIGDPFSPTTRMGALISRSHLDKVLGYIDKGKSEGASLVYGGTEPVWGSSDSKLRKGNFITPAVFLNCSDEMTHVQEEIFGPVMSILTFKSESEVLSRANRTSYGLAAGVFTRDIQRAHRVAAQLQAGTCWINNYNLTPVEVPFGGYKQSGFGRENGLAAMDFYTQLKTVYVEMGDVQSDLVT